MKKITLILISGLLLYACNAEERVKIKVSSEVINADFTGIGVEWDPYDEADDWGNDLSEQDWDKLYRRLDFMRPRFIRCMINSPFKYFNSATGKYEKERNIKGLKKLLQYCQDNNITVMYGEYNPPTWEMKTNQKWVEMSVDYLNYLVSDLGFTCIKYFVIFNEPDGNWASTNGNYELWKQMLLRFSEKMKSYPGLADKVKFAGPDVVADYRNAASKYDTEGWLTQTANDLNELTGLYDIHVYPGQNEVRYGNYTALLNKYKAAIPADKKIIVGEAGFKYWRPADSLLMKEYLRRCENHLFTKGSDCNMLVYDYFYGLDMAILCTRIMNAGYTGIAAWMLDDAMHSSGDSGKPEDIKLWGMWNILGAEVFNDPTQEEIRPWYYAWSLMCRYFPDGCNILKLSIENGKDVFAVAAEKNGQYSLAIINISESDKHLSIELPYALSNFTVYEYSEPQISTIENGFEPVKMGENLEINHDVLIKSNTILLYSNME